MKSGDDARALSEKHECACLGVGGCGIDDAGQVSRTHRRLTAGSHWASARFNGASRMRGAASIPGLQPREARLKA